MTDKVYTLSLQDGEGDWEDVNLKLVDNGDDTYSIATVSPVSGNSSGLCGQITVTTAGTAVQGPDVTLTNGVWIKALPENTGNVACGNDGADDITMSNGFVLEAGDLILEQVSNLNELWFDSAENLDGFCWSKA